MPDSLTALLAPLAGGLGLFLLGMAMMSDGLKLVAGPALHRILSGATRTRWHALGSGVLVTAIVQSSSAVTVAAIGFVNAGLLGLAPALWVLFGANVGTTMTGWIVAMIGLKLKIEVLALPLVGLGVLLKLTGEGTRRGAIGTALAGFGLLFLGISMLQQSFTGLADHLTLPQGDGPLAVLAQLAAGALMTVLMQSSSASMAITLTAVQGGLLDAQGAAAVVIGANVGTTVTALLASMGATANAKRAAAAHVAFNVLTGCVALLTLPWLVDLLSVLRQALGLPPDPAARLALFHTTFNLMGVLLMWPMAGQLTAWLLKRFRAREDDEAQPRYLDDNILAVPTLALDALDREVARAGHLAVRLARSVVAGADAATLAREHAAVTSLDAAVESFIERMNRAAMSQAASERLAHLLRLLRYHETTTEQALLAKSLQLPEGVPPEMTPLQATLLRCADTLLALCDPMAAVPAPESLQAEDRATESAYQALKAALLDAGALGRVRLDDMEEALRRFSALHRAAQQAVKARQRGPQATA